MKKKILFVIPSLSAGGGEKSLVNLLSQIDYKKYEVDLFLFNKTGLFLDLIPKEVNLIEVPEDNKKFTMSFSKSLSNLFIEGKFNLLFSRILFTLINRIPSYNNKEQLTWQYLSKSFLKIENEYDAAIGFLEKSSIYFIVEKVSAKKKIGWIHTNYNNSDMNPQYDAIFFKQLSNIVTVSDECAEALQSTFIELKNKIGIIQNIVSPELIKKLAIEQIDNHQAHDEKTIRIITIARLSHEKGIDLAIDACKILKNNGYNICWQVIGEGTERGRLEQLIKRLDLTKNFVLLGIKANPYPFITNADIYVQPSRYEGKSIAIDEAKILRKPIVVTNFDTVQDQITNKQNGLIVKKEPIAIYEGITEFLNNPILKEFVINNLSKEELSTEAEIYKFYKMVEEVHFNEPESKYHIHHE